MGRFLQPDPIGNFLTVGFVVGFGISGRLIAGGMTGAANDLA